MRIFAATHFSSCGIAGCTSATRMERSGTGSVAARHAPQPSAPATSAPPSANALQPRRSASAQTSNAFANAARPDTSQTPPNSANWTAGSHGVSAVPSVFHGNPPNIQPRRNSLPLQIAASPAAKPKVPPRQRFAKNPVGRK